MGKQNFYKQECIHPQIVVLSAKLLLSEGKADMLADLFKVLGDSTRVKNFIFSLRRRYVYVI